MSRIPSPLAALPLALALCAVGCGEADVVKPPGGNSTDKVNEYLPLAVGNTWKFRVTDNDGVVTDKTTTVLEEQLVGGSGPHKDDQAFFVRTTKSDDINQDKTESWQGTVEIGDQGLATVRYREISYHLADGLPELEEHWDDYKLRVDDFHVMGDTWDEQYTESKIPIPADPLTPPDLDASRYDTWSVQADAETVIVPAGTFMAKVVIRKATQAGDPDKLYWFVKGIGKVRETGSQTEELEEYTVAP